MQNSTLGQEKILIVEDQPANRNLLRKLMTRRGNHVLLAGDGVEGLAVVRREHPALVITDVLMPRMDGYEFVRQLRADPAIADTRVIFYTGNYAESEVRSLAAACGVSRVMDKDAEPEEILRIVTEVLGSSEAVPVATSHAEFDKEHLRVLTDKLSEKVNELEQFNSQLEERVNLRTSEVAAANARLTDLNRMKDEFLAIISHDLRSPLSGIVLGAETMMAQDATIDPARRVELLRKIADCASEQIDFVNDLLALARNEAGGEKLYPSTLRLSDVVLDALTGVSFNAEAKGIQVELTVADPQPVVEADRQRMLQLFNNLLTNAIKFTPAGGKIGVEIAGADGGVCLKISDTGVGIAADRLEEVFDRFNKSHASGTEGETGSGLGLAIARQVAELHGGSIKIESELGVGTTVIVHLPVSRQLAD